MGDDDVTDWKTECARLNARLKEKDTELQEEQKKRKALEDQTPGTKQRRLEEPVVPIASDGDAVVEARSRAEDEARVRRAFRQSYQGELESVLVDEIMRLLRKYDPETDLSPFVAFFQSSGWGKTRFFAELAKGSKVHIVYLHIPSQGTNGYPRPEPLAPLQKVLSQAYSNGDEQVLMWKSLLLRILSCAVKVPPGELWSTFYEDTETSGFQYSAFFKDQLQAASEDLKIENEVSLIFVIDEAGRMGEAENGIEHWRALRRALRDVAEASPKVRVLGIAVATVSAGSQMHPSQHNDPSLRGTLAKKKRFEPLSGLLSNLDKVCRGRPLWSQFRRESHQARTAFAAEKLLCAPPQRGDPKLSSFAKCAMTLSRAPFVLPQHAAGDFVGSHMATVLGTGEKGIGAGYVSDPFLARGAAFAVRETEYAFSERLSDITKLFSRSVNNNGSAGDVGELGVCMILAEAMDTARLSSEPDASLCFAHSAAVKLHDFLRHLFIDDVDIASFSEEDEESKVNFTHFTRVFRSECLEQPEFLSKLWDREAGVICPPGYPGVDIMIPALQQSTESKRVFFWVMFQSKNYNDTCSVPMSAMAPREHRFVKGLDSNVRQVQCGGLYFLLNLRRRNKSTLKVKRKDLEESESGVRFISRCVRVPDRSFLRPLLDGCAESAWENLMALHRHGHDESKHFAGDTRLAAEMYVRDIR